MGWRHSLGPFWELIGQGAGDGRLESNGAKKCLGELPDAITRERRDPGLNIKRFNYGHSLGTRHLFKCGYRGL